MEQLSPVLFQVAMGIGLAASAGLRTFLPLLVVSIAGKLEWVPLAEPFQWFATWPAIIVFGVAVVTELVADKVPVVDHVLDVMQSWVKPVAGALLAVSVLTELPQLEATVLGILAGGSTAGIVHIAKAKTRLLSSATTAGIGNPVLSILEDGVALIGSLASIVVPVLVVLAVVVATILLVLALRRLRPRPAQPG